MGMKTDEKIALVAGIIGITLFALAFATAEEKDVNAPFSQTGIPCQGN